MKNIKLQSDELTMKMLYKLLYHNLSSTSSKLVEKVVHRTTFTKCHQVNVAYRIVFICVLGQLDDIFTEK